VEGDAVLPPFKMPAYSKPYPHYTWSEYNSTLFTTAVFLFIGKPDFIFRCLMTATLGGGWEVTAKRPVLYSKCVNLIEMAKIE
jgi:hypothetical protein